MTKRLVAFLGLFFASTIAMAAGIYSPNNYNPAAVAITGGTISGVTGIKVGTSGTNGLNMQAYTGGGYGAIYNQSLVPSTANYSFLSSATVTDINGPTAAGMINLAISGIVVSAVSQNGLSTSGYTNTTTQYQLGSVLMFSATDPTIASGFGTSPSITLANGTASFFVNVGTGGTATNGAITMPAGASNGWNCQITNSINAANTYSFVSPSTATQIIIYNQLVSTLAATPWGSGTILHLLCTAY